MATMANAIKLNIHELHNAMATGVPLFYVYMRL